MKRWARTLQRLTGQRSHLSQRVSEEQDALAACKEAEQSARDGQALLQGVAQTVQEHAHRQIARVVSRCLSAVYGEEAYLFKIVFEQKRGKTEARLVFTWRGVDVDPCKAASGGQVDVAGFALRLACILLARPAKRRLLCLDEPFRNVDAVRLPRVRELLLSLSSELGVQLLLITHNKQLMCGKVIEIGEEE